jgi:hypothetical protein
LKSAETDEPIGNTGLPVGITEKPVPKLINHFFQKIQNFKKIQIHCLVFQKLIQPVRTGFSDFHENQLIFTKTDRFSIGFSIHASRSPSILTVGNRIQSDFHHAQGAPSTLL